MPIRIVVDSSADFDRTEAKRLNIDIVPMSIQFGDQSFLDGISLSKADFYKQLSEDSANPYTAQVEPIKALLSPKRCVTIPLSILLIV